MRSLHHIYSIWFLTWIEFVKPDIAIIFLQFIQDIFISRIHSFLLLYLNGTILITKLETQEVSQFLKKNLLNIIRPCVNSIFNIHNLYGTKLLIRLHCDYVTVIMILKLQNTFFSTAQVSIIRYKPSWTILEKSTNRFYLTSKIR